MFSTGCVQQRLFVGLPRSSEASAVYAQDADKQLRAAVSQEVFLSEQFERIGLQPVAETFATELGQHRATAGYLVGRAASYQAELVIVSVEAQAAEEAVLLDAARRPLVACYLRQTTPNARFCFVIWSPGVRAEAGVRGFLNNPTWALDQVRSSSIL